MVLMSPPALAVSLHMFIIPGPTKSQPAPNGVICEPVAPVRCTILRLKGKAFLDDILTPV